MQENLELWYILYFISDTIISNFHNYNDFM